MPKAVPFPRFYTSTSISIYPKPDLGRAFSFQRPSFGKAAYPLGSYDQWCDAHRFAERLSLSTDTKLIELYIVKPRKIGMLLLSR